MKNLLFMASLILLAVSCSETKAGKDINPIFDTYEIRKDTGNDITPVDIGLDKGMEITSDNAPDIPGTDEGKQDAGAEDTYRPDTAENPSDVKDGTQCGPDNSCKPGLMCGIENICLDAGDFNTGDMDQKCRTTDNAAEFCYEGLVCNTFGTCELDCSPENNSLCTDKGDFDLSPYSGTYKLVNFDETTECGTNDYSHVQNLGYTYFELKLKDYFGFKYLAFHTCENASNCSDYEKSGYKIVDIDGQSLMEFATENNDKSCTYTSINTYVRKSGKRVMLRYVFNEVTINNSAGDCGSSNVSKHYGEMKCAKIRVINGIKE